MDMEINDLITKLSNWKNNCRDLLIDLRAVKFLCTEEDMYLKCSSDYYNLPLYFKADPDNPSDARIIHAQKQFCKFIGVPYSFFKSNRPSLRMNIVRTWQAGLQAQDNNVQCMARIRESKDSAIIRAIVPESEIPTLNHSLLDSFFKNFSEPCDLEFVHGDGRDDLILHARFLLKNEFDILGRKSCVGFSLITSELGACPLVVDVFLHDVESKTAYIASFGGKPFFQSKFDGLSQQDIKDILPQVVNRVSIELPEMITRVVVAASKLNDIDVEGECIRLFNQKGMNNKYKKSLYHQISECRGDINNVYDFARHASLVAKDFPVEKRLKIERAIGKHLNLIFTENNKGESDEAFN